MRSVAQMLLMTRQFDKLYKKLQSDVCNKYSLSNVELDVLLFLYNNPEYNTAKDIVELRGLAKSYVSKGVDLLIKKELITSYEDKKDRRITNLKLEEKSKIILEEGKLFQENFFNIIYKNISQEDKENLQNILNQMMDNIKGEL